MAFPKAVRNQMVQQWWCETGNHTFQLLTQHGGHIARITDETDAKKMLSACPLENWRKPPGRPHTTRVNSIQQELKSNNLSVNETIDVAQNRPLQVVHARNE